MSENYFKEKTEPNCEALLAAAGWHLKKMMEKLKAESIFTFFKKNFMSLFKKAIKKRTLNFNGFLMVKERLNNK